MKNTEELRHLLNGVNQEDYVNGAGIVLFEAKCDNNAEQVLEKIKEVFQTILSYDQRSWPSDDEWYKFLPSWFVSVCASEKTLEEDEEYLAKWRALSREDQILEEEMSWSVIEWVSWFEPTDNSDEQRYWFWWDAFIKSPNALLISVEVIDIPFPSGSLFWLLKASGAIDIIEANF